MVTARRTIRTGQSRGLMRLRIMPAGGYGLLYLFRACLRPVILHQQLLRIRIPVRIRYTGSAPGRLLYPAFAFVTGAVDLYDFLYKERPVQLGVLGTGNSGNSYQA